MAHRAGVRACAQRTKRHGGRIEAYCRSIHQNYDELLAENTIIYVFWRCVVSNSIMLVRWTWVMLHYLNSPGVSNSWPYTAWNLSSGPSVIIRAAISDENYLEFERFSNLFAARKRETNPGSRFRWKHTINRAKPTFKGSFLQNIWERTTTRNFFKTHNSSGIDVIKEYIWQKW